MERAGEHQYTLLRTRNCYYSYVWLYCFIYTIIIRGRLVRGGQKNENAILLHTSSCSGRIASLEKSHYLRPATIWRQRRLTKRIFPSWGRWIFRLFRHPTDGFTRLSDDERSKAAIQSSPGVVCYGLIGFFRMNSFDLTFSRTCNEYYYLLNCTLVLSFDSKELRTCERVSADAVTIGSRRGVKRSRILIRTCMIFLKIPFDVGNNRKIFCIYLYGSEQLFQNEKPQQL